MSKMRLHQAHAVLGGIRDPAIRAAVISQVPTSQVVSLHATGRCLENCITVVAKNLFLGASSPSVPPGSPPALSHQERGQPASPVPPTAPAVGQCCSTATCMHLQLAQLSTYMGCIYSTPQHMCLLSG